MLTTPTSSSSSSSKDVVGVGLVDKDDDYRKFTMADAMVLHTPPPPVPVTAQRHMFTTESRKALLREVVRLQPYKNPSMWEAVTHRYGWWCYKNICPPRRSVPKDRLRKKVKSIIAKYPAISASASGAINSTAHDTATATAVANAGSGSGSGPGAGADNPGSTATLETALTVAVTPKSAAAGPAAVDDDNMPYDPETLGLIEEVIQQYTESVEMIQARRTSYDGRKRETDGFVGGVPLQSHQQQHPQSPGSSKSPPPSTTNISSLRFRPPILPGSDLLHHDAGSYSSPVRFNDMMGGRSKRGHEEDDDAVLGLNSSSSGGSQHAGKYRKIDGFGDTGLQEDRKGTTSSKFVDDMLSSSEFDAMKDDVSAGGAANNTNNSRVTFFAESVASAASSAIMEKLPELLDAVRDASEESNKARMESLGNSLGTAFASSFSATFEATVNKAIDAIFRRLDDAASTRASAGAGESDEGGENSETSGADGGDGGDGSAGVKNNVNS